MDAETAGGLDRYDPELVDGVRVYWIAEGVAARDETAFRRESTGTVGAQWSLLPAEQRHGARLTPMTMATI